MTPKIVKSILSSIVVACFGILAVSSVDTNTPTTTTSIENDTSGSSVANQDEPAGATQDDSKAALQTQIDKEFRQYCIDNNWVTYIEQNYIDNFYVRLPAAKYTTTENVKSIADYIARAYVLQSQNKGGTARSATVHVFKGEKVVARGSFRQ